MIYSVDDIKIVSGIRVFNSRGNMEGGMFFIFWKAVAWLIELDGSGAHHLCHSSDDIETTTNVQYTPAIHSIYQIIKATLKIIEETDQKKVGVEFYFPILPTVLL